MGGENAPHKTIEGVGLFIKENSKKDDFLINLYGDETSIKDKLNELNISSSLIKIIHTDSTVSDEETPLTAIKNSKIRVCGIALMHKFQEERI